MEAFLLVVLKIKTFIVSRVSLYSALALFSNSAYHKKRCLSLHYLTNLQTVISTQYEKIFAGYLQFDE